MTPTLMPRTGELPAPITAMLHDQDWDGLIRALDDGLPANVACLGDVSLFEQVLVVLEQSGLSASQTPAGPLPLLEAFVRHGLSRQPLYGRQATVVALAAHYGQDEWAQALLQRGYPAEGPDCSALHALIQGRLQRAIGRGHQAMEDAPSDMPAGDVAPQGPTGNVVAFPGPIRQGEPPVARPAPPGGLVFDAGPGAQERLGSLTQALVDAGDSLDQPNDAQFPPLYQAIFHHDQGMVRALLGAGARLDARPEGVPYRPLEMAVTRGDGAIVEDLLAAGAPLSPDPTHPEPAQRVAHPLVLCARMGHDHLVDAIFQALPKDQRQEAGVTAMHVAAANGHVPVMRALRMAGIAYDVPTQPNGFQPIHQAAFAGAQDVLAFLLRRHQSWDAQSASGLSARDVLQSSHPHLMKRFGLQAPSNVAVLWGRKPRKP